MKPTPHQSAGQVPAPGVVGAVSEVQIRILCHWAIKWPWGSHRPGPWPLDPPALWDHLLLTLPHKTQARLKYHVKTFVSQKLDSPGKCLSQPLPHQWSQWHTDQWHWRSLLSSHPLWISWRAHVGGAGATSCLPCHQPDECSGSGTAGQLQYLWPKAYRYEAQSHLAAQRSQSELQSSQAIRKDLPQISYSSLKQIKSVDN